MFWIYENCYQKIIQQEEHLKEKEIYCNRRTNLTLTNPTNKII